MTIYRGTRDQNGMNSIKSDPINVFILHILHLGSTFNWQMTNLKIWTESLYFKEYSTDGT